jgi:hypothetical protein
MNWAILGAGLFLITVLLVIIIRFTVTVSRMSSNALASLISFDQRTHTERELHRQQVQGLIDRIMSGDWESVRLHEGARETEDGGFFTPDEQEEDLEAVLKSIPRPPNSPDEDEEPYVEQERGRWGSGSRAQDRADLLDDAAALAQEDDLDSFDRERGATA